MRILVPSARPILTIIAVGSLLIGCAAGVSTQKVVTDAEIAYGQKEQKILVEKRMEFDQLVDDFILSRNPVFLDKMTGVLDLTEQEIDKAQVFLGLQPPYHRGMAMLRHKAADEAVRAGEKNLCEMLLVFSEINLTYGDPNIARTTLAKLETRFTAESFEGYRKKASLMLKELEVKSQQGKGVDPQTTGFQANG